MSSERASRACRSGRSITVLGALLAIVAGCASPGVSSSLPSTSPPPSPTEVPSESQPATINWGPLAVVPGEDSADTARTEGTLRITDGCVSLFERGGPVLLLWPADRTTWDPEQKTITFANVDGTTATVGDGASVVLGGGGGSSAESGMKIEVWLAQLHWVAPPADGCLLDPYWAVGDLRP